MKPETKTPAVKPEDKKNGDATLAKKEMSQSERFTQMVMDQFTNSAGKLELTNFQKKLCQNYFIRISQTLADLEKKRLATKEAYRSEVSFEWKNVNLQKLAVDVVAYSAVGLDPTQPNHINCIPYLNKGTKKFDIGFIIGYKGFELKVKKYALDCPDDIVVELVYKNDKFKQFKKDMNNKIETYEFEVVNDFDRGDLVGGFYYHVFFSTPEKNKLRVFSKADIEKRKPETAAAEFWGGEKDEWKDGKKTGKKIKVEGWYEEMAYKTIFRAAYNAVTIDSEKIDDHYMSVMEKERELQDARVYQEIAENANRGESIGFEETKDEVNQDPPAAALSIAEGNQDIEEGQAEEEGTASQTTINGPGF